MDNGLEDLVWCFFSLALSVQWNLPRWWAMWVLGRWNTFIVRMAASTSWNSTLACRWSTLALRWWLMSTCPQLNSRWLGNSPERDYLFIYVDFQPTFPQKSMPKVAWKGELSLKLGPVTDIGAGIAGSTSRGGREGGKSSVYFNHCVVTNWVMYTWDKMQAADKGRKWKDLPLQPGVLYRTIYRSHSLILLE